MPVIFNTVNYLHVKLFTLICNIIHKNKAIQILYVCQIVIKEINSYFFLSCFKLDVFGVWWKYKYTVFRQDPSECCVVLYQHSYSVTFKHWLLCKGNRQRMVSFHLGSVMTSRSAIPALLLIGKCQFIYSWKKYLGARHVSQKCFSDLHLAL